MPGDEASAHEAALRAEIARLQDEVDHLRVLRGRCRGCRAALPAAGPGQPSSSAQNDRLASTLRDARDQIVALKAEVDRLAQPPNTFGLFVAARRGRHGRDHQLRPQDAGRLQPVGRRRRRCAPARRSCSTRRSTWSRPATFERTGEIVVVKELIDDDRALVVAHADEERVVHLAGPLREDEAAGR